MGNCTACCESKLHPKDANILQSKWKSFLTSNEARVMFTNDGSLPPNCSSSMLELRVFLDDLKLVKLLTVYAKSHKIEWNKLFSCWSDIQDYRKIDRECIEFRRTKAEAIYDDHIKNGHPEIKPLKGKIEDIISSDISLRQDASLPTDLFDCVLHLTLELLHSSIFVEYRKTENYSTVVSEVKKAYIVDCDDFEYFEKLGQGGYGLVIHAQKKSTGVHYAVKVLAKMGLLKAFRKNEERVLDEKKSLVLCSHPFIIGLEYGYQTDTLAVMVMELGAGSLLDQMSSCYNYKMGLDRVVFYTAEIFLALSHIHRLGFIYRDLKPGNVILCANGHIKLIDLGGMVDTVGRLSGGNGSRSNSTSRYNLFKTSTRQACEESLHSRQHTNVYNLSVMGTTGYMAPEMRRDGTGYTSAVDYWTLGITMFELLCDRDPFTPAMVAGDDGWCIRDFDSHRSVINSGSSGDKEHADGNSVHSIASNFQVLFTNFISKVDNSDFIIYFKNKDGTTLENETIDIIARFLTVDPRKRLGAGPHGTRQIKNHPFFNSINWELLVQMKVEPPFIPKIVAPRDGNPLYENFDEVMHCLCKQDMWFEKPAQAKQKLFHHWDYVSPQALKREIYMESLVL